MRKLILAVAFAAVAMPAVAQVHVRGYVRSDGTYVAPSVRTAPNSVRSDNWSTQGNVNPYNGQQGTQNPYPTFNTPRTPSYNPTPLVQPFQPYRARRF